MDWRQTVEYKQKVEDALHIIMFGTFSLGEWLPWTINSYMILAPKQLVGPKSTWSVVLLRTLLVVLIIGTSLVFLSIRLFCRRTETHETADRVELLFDTFARTLGLSAGTWLGRTRAERQALVVVSIFSILLSSVFSGVLYARTMNSEAVQRYNTLQELCDGNVTVNIDRLFLYSLLLIMKKKAIYNQTS